MFMEFSISPMNKAENIFPDFGSPPRIKPTLCQRTFYHLSRVLLCLFFLNPVRRMTEHYLGTRHGYFNTKFVGYSDYSKYSSI